MICLICDKESSEKIVWPWSDINLCYECWNTKKVYVFRNSIDKGGILMPAAGRGGVPLSTMEISRRGMPPGREGISAMEMDREIPNWGRRGMPILNSQFGPQYGPLFGPQPGIGKLSSMPMGREGMLKPAMGRSGMLMPTVGRGGIPIHPVYREVSSIQNILSQEQEQFIKEREERINLEEDEHIYYVDGNDDYTSVTTWVDSHFKEFNSDEALDKMFNGKYWNENHRYWREGSDYEIRESIKEEWETNGLNARTLGTELHKQIEDYHNDCLDIEQDLYTKEFNQFLNFEKSRDQTMKVFRAEMRMFDEDLKTAGTVDMLYLNPDGTFSIYDWKRSKVIRKTNKFQNALTECISHLPDTNYYHYVLQLNMYKYILENKYNIEIKDMFITVFHPERSKYMSYEILDLPEFDELLSLI